MCFHVDRIKRTDSDKLQNEYARLVEGLQDADAARDEDSFMSNPSRSRVCLRVVALMMMWIYSSARRYPQRSCTRQHQKSGTLYCLSGKVCRVFKGSPEFCDAVLQLIRTVENRHACGCCM